jgi:hypothetical protein
VIQELARLFARDLVVLERELALYPDDASLWVAVPGLSNPGGNLAQHLVGNLRHFVGATLGGTSYVRHRDREFTDREAGREALIRDVRTAAAEVRAALEGLDRARMEEPFPLEVGGGHPPTGLFLMHLLTHLAFHLGQLDYHRRAATGQATSAGAVPTAALF